MCRGFGSLLLQSLLEGFVLRSKGVSRGEWADVLVDALKREGFEKCRDKVREWSNAKAEYDTEKDKLGWSKVVMSAVS
jgi:hypothetical protein